MDNPSTTPTGTGPAASLPGTQDRAGRGDLSGQGGGASRPGSSAPGEAAERLAKQGAAQIGREARDLKDSAKQGASDAAAKVKDVAGQTAEQVRQQAGQFASQFREKGSALVEQQKTRAADLIGDCVSATRRAAQKLHDENDHNLAGYADAFAERLDSTARYLREQDPRRLVDDAADLARRRPEWVLGGAFVVGLALARFLKASRPEGAAYGSYRYDRPESFGGEADYGGAYGAGSYGAGGSYGTGYGVGYGGGYTGGGYTGGAREYGGSSAAQGDAFGQQTGPASTLSGNTPGTLDTPGVTTTATGSWTPGGTTSTTGGTAPATSGPDPTTAPTSTTPGISLDPVRRDNPEGI